MALKHLFLLCSVFVCTYGFSQQKDTVQSNFRSKLIKVNQPVTFLDSQSIIPNTLSINGIVPQDYEVNYPLSFIRWRSSKLPDSVQVEYRVYPFNFNQTYSRYNYDSIRFNFTKDAPYTVSTKRNSSPLNFGDLSYNGSFGRGMSLGTNQDVIVNSTFNLNISGYLADSLELLAALSDNNLPIQPQGNTQNLRDFDRIFIQVKKKNWRANFGDIDIRQQHSDYFSFFKRIQGASFYTTNQLSKNISNSLVASGAIAKGKFATNKLKALEGNQGPYKLSGGNNEVYFSILAGTERVYMNGELLKRGEDADYIIDYNTAELTFMVKRPVTKDVRIVVEFEYSDRNFLNSFLYLSDELNVTDKWKISVSAYSNSDAKNTSINQSLTTEQKQFLSGIGNNIDSARFPNAQIDTFSVNKILYRKADTLYNGIHDSIYVYSTNPTDTLYSLSFTPVGEGKGDYVPANSDANGRVFKWVAPINGMRQGSWSPGILLITPKKHQVLGFAASYQINKESFVRIQMAGSDYDLNTFSSKDKGDNKGLAGKIDYGGSYLMKRSSGKAFTLNMHVQTEYISKNFVPIEPLHTVEFYRDWGLSFLPVKADEKIINATVQATDQKGDYLKYSFGHYYRSDDYSGFRNAIENKMQLGDWSFSNWVEYTSTNYGPLKGYFFRPTFSLSKQFKSLKNIKIGGSFQAEVNKQLNQIYDTLTPLSFAFNTWKIFVKSDESKLNKWTLSYAHRENEIPLQSKLITSDVSDNITLGLELLKSEKRQILINATYRKLNAKINTIPGLKSDETFLGRVEYLFNEWNEGIRGGTWYELGSGQEQQREFTYVEVPAGQGYYKWVDYNNDGIPQLNEFEIAVFQDEKKWVRIFTPTNVYIKANYLQFNYNLTITPAQFFAKDKSKFLSRITFSSALQIQRKNIADRGINFNPFDQQLSDSTLLSLASYLSNTLYFNRQSSIWGFDLTQRIAQNKSLLNYGFESNSRIDWSLKWRWNFNKSFSILMNNQYVKRELATPAFLNRNYLINEYLIEPSLVYIYKTDFRLSLNYGFDQRKNSILQKENALKHSLTAEVRYNVLSSGILNGRFTLNNVSFNGDPNTTAGYVLLDGLLPGKNYLWNLELTKKIWGGIEMNLQYEGRKSANTKAIHTGRATLRAVF